MKKSVQALIKRRRARLVPAVLAGLAGLVLFAFVFIVFNFFTSGPGAAILRSPTPTATATFTPSATPSAVPATPTPEFTATPTETPGPSPTPTPVTYVVQDGDTLFGIAVQFQVDVEAIKLFNNLTGDALSVGQTLIIPQGQEVQTPTPTPLPTGLPRAARIEYTVLLGDTLEIIAGKFNSTAEDIARQNRRNNQDLTNADLRAGEVLVVRINLVTPTLTPVASRTP
ncbi:MAG: LysM peptidoglycan-binding domain-containing protein [Anaerolineales bacterium]|nr:LysM peptidoglycan-binding domain-containing protein [Anaerolineales bacterium]